MSYILEALKKSDAERKRKNVNAAEATNRDKATTTPLNDSKNDALSPAKPWKIALAVILIGAGGFYARAHFTKTTDTNHVKKSRLIAQTSPAPSKSPITATPNVSPKDTKEKNIKTTFSHPADTNLIIKKTTVTPSVVTKPAEMPTSSLKTVKKITPSPAPPSVKKTPTYPTAMPPPIVVAKKTPKRPPPPRLKDAAAYVERAWNKMDRGLYGQAIKELDQALSIEPAFSDAWFARGWANEKSGNEQAAIKDYDRAIEAKPNHAFALFSRGYLKLYTNDPQGAVVDFVRTQGVAKDDALRLYSRLWLYLSRERAGQNGRARLVEDTANENLTPWPGPLIRFFQGDLSEQEVVKAIESTLDADLKEVRATGYFFLGISQQLTGNAQNARTYFEKTLATGAIQYRQYDAARRELERLNKN